MKAVGWIMYGRCQRGAYPNQWVKIASGWSEREKIKAKQWWTRHNVYDEFKIEKANHDFML
mgnify:CR=1 FL=1